MQRQKEEAEGRLKAEEERRRREDEARRLEVSRGSGEVRRGRKAERLRGVESSGSSAIKV